VCLNHPVIEFASKASEYSATDLILIILTATAVILAALGVLFAIATVVLGAFAVFGYNDFKRMMREENQRMMEEFFAKYPSPQALRMTSSTK